jgi:hypothetical protein
MRGFSADPPIEWTPADFNGTPDYDTRIRLASGDFVWRGSPDGARNPKWE